MQLRPLATAAAVLALAAPLTSCGFDYATDREYDVTSAAASREGVVDVLNAVVVSGAEGSGTFIASFVNNDSDDEHTLTSVAGAEGATVTAGEFEPVTIEPAGIVNLADPAAGVVLTGDFTAGNVVPLSIAFGNGESVSLNVPVVADDTGYWEGMDVS